MGSAVADLDNAVDQHLAVQPTPPPPAASGHPPATSGSPSSAAPSSSGAAPISGASLPASPGGVPGSPAPAGGHGAPAPPAPGLDLGVGSNWLQGLQSSVKNLVNPAPPAKPQSSAQQAVATARRVQAVVGGVLGGIGVVGDMINAGFANLTAPLAKVFPSLPAATITMMYVGVPHTHSHPPSLIPPAPPVPLPSLGTVLLGICVRVLINGMPAARCGDIGIAPTCCGLAPFFQIKTGSSNTFIGGNRAARLLDVCQVCAKADERKDTIDAGKIMGAIGSVARGIQKAQSAMGYAAIAMDAAEAATEDDAAMQSAKAMAAAMAAAQMAADKAAQALSKTMGTDPAVLPPRALGAIVLGHPNVLIGWFPMVNIPNPADLLLKRLARYKRKPEPKKPPGPCGTPDCDT